MNRRNFLKNGSVAGLVITSIATKANTVIKKKSINKTFQTANNFVLNEITIDELQKKMENGSYTSRMITEWYLKQIHEIDINGPKLNSIIELNPDALLIADKMDAERKLNKIRGPLHGIPVLLKDNINTADKMMTTAGSLSLVGNYSEKDAFIVSKLRDAGAVLLGKTNLSEWANFRSTRPTSGWSSRGGQTKNPNILDRNPSGSSSGSGAAVSANLCVVAIGTETDGSITAPASFCGIVGIKPTVGLLSRSGIIPISKTQDTPGPMARTVKDAALLLSVMTGTDPEDAITSENKGKSHQDYSKFLILNGLNGKKIGIEKSFLKGHEGVVNLYNQAIEILKRQGAIVVEIELLKSTSGLSEAEFMLMKYEFKDGLNKYLSNTNAKLKSLSDVIEFNNKNETKTMPFFKQEILEECNSKEGLDHKEYTDALQKSLSARKIIDDMMSKNNLDAIVATTIGLPCCIDLINGDYDTGFYFGSPAAMAGYPHITVPMGKVHGLPVGISFIAGAYQEDKIISMAYAFEQATKKREAPSFLNTLKNF